jgi:2-dehydro-3-deoxyphosphogluconate aldolase/(4S)-4-hydroxy-2-oxoglutarate aldolase
MNLTQTLRETVVVPVLTIERAADAVPLARALVAGGIRVLEITLRTAAALEAMTVIAAEVDGAVAAAGTVLNEKDAERAAAHGAKFAFSPGATPALLKSKILPLVPGVATASDIMNGLDQGFSLFKLFPAVAAGGIATLKSFAGPFADVRFCPTGGIDATNAADFLALKNVVAVGGSWLAPALLVREGRWSEITALARAAAALKPAS